VIEVAHHDPATKTYYVCSGFGKQSNWYQNLQAQPDVWIRVGGQTLPVMANLLSAEASGEEMVRYANQHPGLARTLAGFLTEDPPTTPEEYRQLGEEHLPFVAFEPRTDNNK